MRVYKIKVLPNKQVKCINGDIVCKKGENKIDVLSFEVDKNLLQFNNFLILNSPNNTTYIDILTTDLEYVIGSFITNNVGSWSIQFISTTQEDIVVESEIDENQIIMISDVFKIKVVDSLASGELVLPPTSANLDLLGEQLANIYNTLSLVIEEYDQVEDYIELQEELKVIEDLIKNIKIDVGEVSIDNTEVLKAIDEVKEDIENINVDFSPIETQISNVSEQVSNIPTNDYTNTLSMINSKVDGINNMVQNGVVSNINTLNDKIGNNDTKQDGTLFNYSYWGLVRAEEAKVLSQQILSQLSEVNSIVEDILE